MKSIVGISEIVLWTSDKERALRFNFRREPLLLVVDA
jgi:hypothetical protein